MLLALALVAFVRRPRAPLAVALAVLGCWLPLDQNRWQPYALFYGSALVCLMIGERRVRERVTVTSTWHLAPLQLLLICAYAYSGLHKFNYRYVTREALEILQPIVSGMGLQGTMSNPVSVVLGFATAGAELLLGLALLHQRTRRTGVIGLTGMHLLILLAIGPFGRAYNHVVWPWNVASAISLWILFWDRGASGHFDHFMRAWWMRLRKPLSAGSVQLAPRPLRAAWHVAIAMFVVAPALSFVERWDAGLSFQMYSAKQPVALVHLRSEHRDRLPPSARAAILPDGSLDLFKWGLRDLGATPVLERRVLVHAARELAGRMPDANIRLLRAGPPSTIFGDRTVAYYAFTGPLRVPVDVAWMYRIDVDDR